MKSFSIFMLSSSLLYIFIFSTAVDIITTTQSIRDGETLVSGGASFELGFFRPGESKNRYLGIWYKKISMTVVWVANRETPLIDSSAVLKLTEQGILVLLNGTNGIIWSSNSSSSSPQSPVAQLLDSGDLVVREAKDDKPENFLWQSFDYLSDTLLPGMKIGISRTTGFERFISSWKSPDDPSPGEYSIHLDPHGFQQFFLNKGTVLQSRSAAWNGIGFSGMPGSKANQIYRFDFVQNQEETYYTFAATNTSVVSRFVLSPTGIMQRFMWNNRTQEWVPYFTGAVENCANYALCGSYAACNMDNSPVCGCLKGFVPKFPKDWDGADWTNGCVRKTSLHCQSDGFQKYPGIKLPDTKSYWYDESLTLEECRMVCLKNCSCTAYANTDVRGRGSGCLIWFGNLIDMRKFNENEQDLYVRVAASEMDQGNSEKFDANSDTTKRTRIIASAVIAPGMLLLVLALVLYVCKMKNKQNHYRWPTNGWKKNSDKTQKENLELPLFDLATIANATDNFSFQNKLGEGGFGPVYKGVLKDGQEIAVKRLSKSSKQGLDEFKNEVMHIAKLQHRNLVRLLGCCIQEDENMLVYEYMPNNSLDYFIFGQAQSMVLDWSKRYQIINGIGRGLLYLHQDSRLRIIHRDLKAGNVLLDNAMNPKISDFGLARSFGENETHANTRRVVGTYGYMSPEYAIDGLYSIKSDIFSFGVLVLEIVSGKRNRGFNHPDHQLNLLGHAWKLYTEGRSLELIDESLGDSYNPTEALRSIQLGLLCVQRHPEDRPSMSSVVLMLAGEGELPSPKQPGFYTERNLQWADESSSSKHGTCSVGNEMSITLLHPR